MAVRLISGQDGLNYFNNKVDPVNFPTPLCRFCGEMEEKGPHIISTCPSLWKERITAFQNWIDLDLSKIKPKQLHKYLKIERIKKTENITENPLLFLDDYKNVTHDHPIHKRTRPFLFIASDNEDNDQNAPKRIRKGVG